MRKVWVFGLFISAVTLIMVGCNSETSGDSADFPSKDITLVVPFSAGGSVDRMARGLSNHWSEQIGQTMVVENRDGAGGQIGYSHFINSDPDGHTILVGVDPYLSMAMLRGADYTLDDFAIINVQQFDPVAVAVRSDSEFQTIEDLIEHIKANPGEVSYGAAADGALQIVGESMAQELDLEMRAVMYDGGGDIRTALLAGEVDFGFVGTTGVLSLEDEARTLGIVSSNPFPAAPELPLLNDELEPYGVEISDNGSTRFIAVQSELLENNPEIFETLVDTYEKTLNDENYISLLAETDEAEITEFLGPKDSETLMRDLFETMQEFEELLLGGD